MTSGPVLSQSGQMRGAETRLHRDDVFGEVSSTAPGKKNLSEIVPPRDGTPNAIEYLTSGVPAHLARTPRTGGARNWADRVSLTLNFAHVKNLIEATKFAVEIGLPFTRMISIHWQAAGVSLASMAKATGRFTDLLAKLLNRRGSKTAWIWTHENGLSKGAHCHLLAHIPAEHVTALTRLQKKWLRLISGHPYRARVIRSSPIGGRLGIERGNPALHAINLNAAMCYVLKGASHAAALKFNLDRVEPCGCIIGKRCSNSQNIGPKARQLSGCRI